MEISIWAQVTKEGTAEQPVSLLAQLKDPLERRAPQEMKMETSIDRSFFGSWETLVGSLESE